AAEFCFLRIVRHGEPVRHARLEMLEYAGLSSRHADRQRLAVCHAKLDDVGAVAFRTVDHDAALAARRCDAHLRGSFDQSSSASRFTAGASDDIAEVRGLGFSGAWVKHSPPKRLRNASAVVKPNFQILPRHRRSLLLRLEHPHRSAVENHFHRPTRLGSSRSLKLRIGINAPTAALCMKLSDTRKPSPTIRMRRTAKSVANRWT